MHCLYVSLSKCFTSHLWLYNSDCRQCKQPQFVRARLWSGPLPEKPPENFMIVKLPGQKSGTKQEGLGDSP